MSTRKSLVETVMGVEDVSREEAVRMVSECREELMERLADGDMPDNILQEWFGIEPDWLDELI